MDPQSKEHVRTLQHLLEELRVATSEDTEAARLVKAIDGEFQMLLPGNPATLQWQTELNMALQPVRNENAQLRRFDSKRISLKFNFFRMKFYIFLVVFLPFRRVRILNHQLQEKERLQMTIAEGGNKDFDGWLEFLELSFF